MIQDVLLVPHFQGAERGPLNELRQLRNQPIELINGLRVERIGDADTIMKACEPWWFWGGSYRQPTRQYGCYYAIVQDDPPNNGDLKWDPDQEIRRVVVLSRLVHPTPTGYEYTARVGRNDDGTIERVEVLQDPIHAYGGDMRQPWLTRAEWEQIGKLLERWRRSSASNCERIKRALSYHEAVFLEYYREIRWTLLVTAIEALVGHYDTTSSKPRIRKGGRGERFRKGLLKLAHCVGLSFNDDKARDVWELRSQLVHGAGWPSPGPSIDYRNPGGDAHDSVKTSLHERLPSSQENVHLFDRVARVLGACIRRMIKHDDLASHFANDAAVEKWLKAC